MAPKHVTFRDCFSPIAPQLAEPGSEERREFLERLKAALPRAEWVASSPQLLEKFAELLDFELPSALMECWKTSDRIREALKRSRATPHENVAVALVEHTVEIDYHPQIELLVAVGRAETKYVLPFDLLLSCELSGAELQVRNGVIRAITAGTCMVTGTLQYDGMVLARAPRAGSEPIALRGTLDLAS